MISDKWVHSPSASMSAPSSMRNSTSSGWSNIAAQWSGVIFWMSVQNKLIFFSFGCSSNISRTISSEPCALVSDMMRLLTNLLLSCYTTNYHARCTGVDKSCCCVEIFAPDFRQSSTAFMSPPWTAEWSGTFPSESKNEIISSRVQPRDSPHYVGKRTININ